MLTKIKTFFVTVAILAVVAGVGMHYANIASKNKDSVPVTFTLILTPSPSPVPATVTWTVNFAKPQATETTISWNRTEVSPRGVLASMTATKPLAGSSMTCVMRTSKRMYEDQAKVNNGKLSCHISELA